MSWVMFIVARKLLVRFLQVEGIRVLVIQIVSYLLLLVFHHPLTLSL